MLLTTDELRTELKGAKAHQQLMLAYRTNWPRNRKAHGEKNLKALGERIEYLAGELAMATGK